MNVFSIATAYAAAQNGILLGLALLEAVPAGRLDSLFVVSSPRRNRSDERFLLQRAGVFEGWPTVVVNVPSILHAVELQYGNGSEAQFQDVSLSDSLYLWWTIGLDKPIQLIAAESTVVDIEDVGVWVKVWSYSRVTGRKWELCHYSCSCAALP